MQPRALLLPTVHPIVEVGGFHHRACNQGMRGPFGRSFATTKQSFLCGSEWCSFLNPESRRHQTERGDVCQVLTLQQDSGPKKTSWATAARVPWCGCRHSSLRSPRPWSAAVAPHAAPHVARLLSHDTSQSAPPSAAPCPFAEPLFMCEKGGGRHGKDPSSWSREDGGCPGFARSSGILKTCSQPSRRRHLGTACAAPEFASRVSPHARRHPPTNRLSYARDRPGAHACKKLEHWISQRPAAAQVDVHDRMVLDADGFDLYRSYGAFITKHDKQKPVACLVLRSLDIWSPGATMTCPRDQRARREESNRPWRRRRVSTSGHCWGSCRRICFRAQARAPAIMGQ